MNKALAIAAPLVLLATLQACHMGQPLLRRELVKETTVTNTIAGVESVEVQRETNVLFIVNPAWTSAIETARDVNGAANPTPFGPVVELGLAALSGYLALLARKRNQRAKELDQVLDAVVEGVENGGHQETKKAIEKAANRKGLNQTLNEKVQTRRPS